LERILEVIDLLGADLWGPPDELARADFASFSQRYDQGFFEELRNRLSDAAAPPCLQGYGVVRRIVAIRDARKPASIVRISDGEGNLTPLAFDIELGEHLNDYCLRRISYIHFGTDTIITRSRGFWTQLIREAIDEADLLGFPGPKTTIGGFAIEDRKKDVRGICGNRSACIVLSQIAGRLALYTDAWFSRGILPHYQDILQGEERIGLVSVYPDLAEKLMRTFSIRRIDFIKVPTQAVFVPTKERKDTGHYPHEMNRILREISPSFVGMIFLVAAGLLGKKYCTEIKRRGGIAIDIGSIAEIWMGIQARGLDPEYIRRWTL
jgi:hypothetical protein